MVTFMDVGANVGQTLAEVTKERWGFDRILAYEPHPPTFATLASYFGNTPRVELREYGLASLTADRLLYGTNDNIEASLYPDKDDVDPKVFTRCRFVSASAEVNGLDGPIVMKLNCEGAEAEILDNLLETGAIHRLEAVMIDWDVRKIPSRKDDEPRLLKRMHDAGFDRYQLCDDVMRGDTHQDRIANWLGGVL